LQVRHTGRAPKRIACAALLAASLAACSTPEASWQTTTAPLIQEPEATHFPSSEPYRRGFEHFQRGDYGLAEQYFREAVEKTPKDVKAWIGLAASYDKLRRFDLADRAYENAIKLSGKTALILNNQGYSYLLRGNLKAARAAFQRALELDPGNPTLINNIKLLDNSAQYLKPGGL